MAQRVDRSQVSFEAVELKLSVAADFLFEYQGELEKRPPSEIDELNEILNDMQDVVTNIQNSNRNESKWLITEMI